MTMPNFPTLLALFLTFLSISTYATNIPTSNINEGTNTGSNYTYVCNAYRYASLGLDMSKFAFCNKSLPYHARAANLVLRMTLYEKVRQLGNKAYGVRRLGLPGYEWWSEALHGVSNTGPGTFFDDVVPGATSFPTVILTTASFNASLWKTIGQVVSTEARAMYNLGRAGLTFWSPNINVVRDARWGRVMETPGEDPFTVGTYAVNYVRGLQDVEGTENYTDLNSRPLKVASCCKHYAAYDLENWEGVDRFTFDAIVTEQDMEETFLRPFEMCVKEGDVSSVMCSFNNVDGIPPCADPKLLNQTIRNDWNLHGYIVSDCDSIEVIVENHKWLNDTKEDAVAQTLQAGLDLDCGIYYTNYTATAVQQGKVKEADIDRSLKYLYVVLMRVGYFDGISSYDSLGKNDICSDAHIELALEAAKEGIVLLKNDNRTLPWDSSKLKSIALVGPHANATSVMLGNYAGVPCHLVSPLDAFSSFASVDYKMGCGDVQCVNDSLIFPATEAAKKADATIIFAGLDLSVEREGLDRTDFLLPGNQTQLINQVAEAATGPVILVLMCAGGVDISFAKMNPKIGAILWVGYPGEEGGQAIAQIVYGKHNPGGRLPLTWYEENHVNMLPMTSMRLRPIHRLGYPGRTYKFFNGSTVYPFGYGLSYTQFGYKLSSNTSQKYNVKLDKFQKCHALKYGNESYMPLCSSVLLNHLSCHDKFEFEVEVQNLGSMDGSDVVMVYSKPPKGVLNTYIKQLIAFERVFVPARTSKKVKFSLNVCKSLSLVDYNAYKVLPSGLHTIVLGDEIASFPFHVSFS